MTTWPFDPRLQEFGATFKPANVAPGQRYWKLIRAAGPLDRGGNPNIYVDCIDFGGRRLAGVPVRFFWGPNSEFDYIGITELKDPVYDPDQGTNMVMNAGGNAYGVHIADGNPSDTIFGMGLVPFENHRAFQLVFQEAMAEPPIIVPEPPDNPISALEAIEFAEFYLRMAKEKLAAGL